MDSKVQEERAGRLDRRAFVRLAGLAGGGLTVMAAGGALAACSPQQLAARSGAPQRLSIATGGTGGVYYPYGGGVAKIVSETLPNVQATAEVTSASVDNLKFLREGKADIIFTLADSLDDAYKGTGPFAEFGKVGAMSLAVLYTNFTQVVTTTDKGIGRIADLRGRVVGTGAAGSGTEIIAFRVLEAAGINPQSDIQKQSLGVAQSVEALKDGKLDAFFWSGGVPTGALLDLANTPRAGMRLLGNEDVLPTLQQRYGQGLYYPVTIPANAYPGQDAAVPVVGVSNCLVVLDKMSEDLAYRLTKVMFDKQAELIAIHPEAKNLTLETATVGSPVPFHPGAIKYYRERNAWRG